MNCTHGEAELLVVERVGERCSRYDTKHATFVCCGSRRWCFGDKTCTTMHVVYLLVCGGVELNVMVVGRGRAKLSSAHRYCV
jgi:hypothetical protein